VYDSSKVGLKIILSHNGKKFPSVPLAHTANVKELYENMKLILEKIQYEKYNWNICGYLKVNDLLLSYTKFCCFLCEWNNWDRKFNYNQKDWPKGEQLIPGQKSVENTQLINPKKVHLPPLHFTLGLIKYFVKAMDHFMYLKNKFPRINNPRIKEGVFVGPQIRAFIEGVKFEDQLN